MDTATDALSTDGLYAIATNSNSVCLSQPIQPQLAFLPIIMNTDTDALITVGPMLWLSETGHSYLLTAQASLQSYRPP